MNEDQKAMLREYVDTKAAIKELEEKAKVLNESIKSFANVDDKFDLGFATVTCSPGKTTWKYSPELTAKEKALKDDKKREEQTGVAVAVAGEPFLVVRFGKE